MEIYEYKDVKVEIKQPKEMAFTIAKQILEIRQLSALVAELQIKNSSTAAVQSVEKEAKTLPFMSSKPSAKNVPEVK